jgi:16S rRNA (uracil1498-N3)-methyltransferase
MQLFFNDTLTEGSKSLTFDKIESRHIVKVLRKKEGDVLDITNGNGLSFKAIIFDASEKHCSVNIESFEVKQKSHPYYLHIAIAPTKNLDRLEWFLEKATEIGIDEITLLLCDRSERKVIKPERLEKILIAAAKQSLHFHTPVLNPLTTFKDFISKTQTGEKLIALCENETKIPLKQAVKVKQNALILIGPEGDFSPQEIQAAKKSHFIPVSLGESRLRTETAGIVACHSVAFINE